MKKELLKLYEDYCDYLNDIAEEKSYFNTDEYKQSFYYFMQWLEDGFIIY